jgi:uncharacterized membrane protein YeiH
VYLASVDPLPVDALADLIGALRLDEFFELAAIFISGLAGGLAGIRKGFDVFGVLVLAWAASLAGGVLRDVMIGSIPPVGISNWRFMAASVGGGVVVYFLYPWIMHRHKAIVILDAFALALFVWVGTVKGLEYGMGALASAAAGVLTGIGGGVVRDLFTDNVPLVLADRQFYAIPACVGAAATVLLARVGWLNDWTALLVIAGIAGFRLIALKLHWAVPAPHAKASP